MDNETQSIYDKIVAIHNEAIEVLRLAHIPPYPIHYQKQFNKIFDSLSDKTLKNALNHDLAMDDKINSIVKYIELTKMAIDSYTQSQSAIFNVAEQQNNLLNSFNPQHTNPNQHCIEIVNGLLALSENMTQELKNSEEKILLLNEQMNDAMLDVTTDPLTHLYNHRKYMEDLTEILSKGLNDSLPFLSLMINADSFKEINQKYGHTTGDRVLYFLAQTLKSMTRAGDFIYRYGGDQFAVLINRCDKEKAMIIAQKMLYKIEHSHLIHNGQSIELTISIGATMHTKGDTIDTFIRRSEDALSQSKQSGKNQITIL